MQTVNYSQVSLEQEIIVFFEKLMYKSKKFIYKNHYILGYF